MGADFNPPFNKLWFWNIALLYGPPQPCHAFISLSLPLHPVTLLWRQTGFWKAGYFRGGALCTSAARSPQVKLQLHQSDDQSVRKHETITELIFYWTKYGLCGSGDVLCMHCCRSGFKMSRSSIGLVLSCFCVTALNWSRAKSIAFVLLSLTNSLRIASSRVEFHVSPPLRSVSHEVWVLIKKYNCTL